jgi:hypothetical protein
MVRASRSDSLFYSIKELHGKYIVALYRQNGEEIRTYDQPFSTEVDAINAARVAVKVFEESK